MMTAQATRSIRVYSGSSFLNAPPGLPEFGYFICPSRQQPTWMAWARNPFDHVLGREMDSGLDACASPRNDDGETMQSVRLRENRFACLVPARGAARDRHGRWVRDAMDAIASGAQVKWRADE